MVDCLTSAALHYSRGTVGPHWRRSLRITKMYFFNVTRYVVPIPTFQKPNLRHHLKQQPTTASPGHARGTEVSGRSSFRGPAMCHIKFEVMGYGACGVLLFFLGRFLGALKAPQEFQTCDEAQAPHKNSGRTTPRLPQGTKAPKADYGTRPYS